MLKYFLSRNSLQEKFLLDFPYIFIAFRKNITFFISIFLEQILHVVCTRKGFSYMGQVGTSNKDLFDYIRSVMHDTLVTALLQVRKNVFSLYDLYGWKRLPLFGFFCSFVSIPLIRV